MSPQEIRDTIDEALSMNARRIADGKYSVDNETKCQQEFAEVIASLIDERIALRAELKALRGAPPK